MRVHISEKARDERLKRIRQIAMGKREYASSDRAARQRIVHLDLVLYSKSSAYCIKPPNRA